MKPEETQFAAVDIESGDRVWLRSASVQWNEFRRRWIMIAQQTDGKTSKLGEIWYLEADTPLGPWAFARKILTHDRYSFYEVVQHPEFDQQGGRLIYFSGTYSDFLVRPPNITPRYDYKLIMYRLDLADARLHLPVAVYRVAPGAQMTMEQAEREMRGIVSSASITLDWPGASGRVRMRCCSSSRMRCCSSSRMRSRSGSTYPLILTPQFSISNNDKQFQCCSSCVSAAALPRASRY